MSPSNGIGAEVLQPFSCSAESTGLHISHEGPIQESEQVSTSALVVSSKSVSLHYPIYISIMYAPSFHQYTVTHKQDVMESESDPQTEIAVQHVCSMR